MEPNSSEAILESPEILPEIEPKRKLYFINEDVEWLLTQYLWTGCTSVILRDKIMANATELIRQIIRKQGLHTIYPGQEESAFGDLLQTAWVQIERVLYKYRSSPHCRVCFNPDRPSDSILYNAGSREYGVKNFAQIIEIHNGHCPHCKARLTASPIIESSQGTFGGSDTILYRGKSKVFNMWSQIARTVILAFIKKEGRDRKNSSSYQSYLGNRARPHSDIMDRFLAEAKEICTYHADYMIILASLEYLINNDERPHDGIIGKLVAHSGMSRITVTNFMRFVKLRSMEFTDSPINRSGSENRGRNNNGDDENENED